MSTPTTALSSNNYPIQNPGPPKMTPLIPAPFPSQPASSAAVDPGVSTPAQPSGGGVFSRIGQALQKYAPYISTIANHVAAAAGNYGPLEEQHQEEELALRQQNAGLQRDLAQSTMATQDLNRQRLQQEISQSGTSYQTPQQIAQAQIDQKNTETRNALQAQNELGPGQVVASPLPTGGYGQFRVRGNNAEPIMTHQSVPNPTQAPGAGIVPPLGGQNLISPAQSSDQATQLMALPKGMTKGPAIMGNDGQWKVPVYNPQQGLDHYEHLDGTPIAALPTSTSGLKTELKDDGQGHLVPVQIPTSSRTRKVVPSAPGTMPAVPMASGAASSAPPTMPATNGGIPGVKVGTPVLDAKAPKIVTDAFNVVQDSTSRYNIMNQNLKPAMAGDQQAMLSLLTNHIGMTLGLQKGARITQSILEEAQKSAPWLQALSAKVGPDGYLSGVTLTPQQMNSMVDLAKNRLAQDQRKYTAIQQEAGRGFQSGTPQTMPSTSALPPTNHGLQIIRDENGRIVGIQ
jgi:hypothetical protein